MGHPIVHPVVLDACRVWPHTSLRYCADGAANRLYECFEKGDKTKDVSDIDYLPDVILGDLDSLHPHVNEFYRYDLRDDVLIILYACKYTLYDKGEMCHANSNFHVWVLTAALVIVELESSETRIKTLMILTNACKICFHILFWKTAVRYIFV